MTRGVGSRPCRSQQGATQIPKGTRLLEAVHGAGTTGTLGMAPGGPRRGATGRRGHLTQPRELSQRCLPKSAPAQTRAQPASCWLAQRNPALCKRLARPPESCLESGACPVTLSPAAAGLWLNAPKHLPGRRPGGPFPTARSTTSRSLFPLPAGPVGSPSQAAAWPRGQATMSHHHEGRPNLRLAAGHADCPGEEEKKA